MGSEIALSVVNSLKKFVQPTEGLRIKPKLSRYDYDETGLGDHYLETSNSYLWKFRYLHGASSCAFIQLPDNYLTIFAVRDSFKIRKYTLIANLPGGRISDISVVILKGHDAGQRFSLNQHYNRPSDPERFYEHCDPDPRICEIKLRFLYKNVRVEQILEFDDRAIPRSRLKSIRNC